LRSGVLIMKVKDLIKRLETFPDGLDVEFLVVRSNDSNDSNEYRSIFRKKKLMNAKLSNVTYSLDNEKAMSISDKLEEVPIKACVFVLEENEG
jgi:hypothetical protein